MASSSGTNDSANSLPSLSLASEKLVDSQPPSNSSSSTKLSKRAASDEDGGHHDCAAIHKKIRELKLSTDPNNASSHLDYKSGATYEGQVKDNSKSGYGEFLWPNGDKYVGEFRLNARHGYGCQWWNDGSCYEGYFHEDKRSGQGVHKWKKGEIFDGNWFFDYRHGFGKYKWSSSNTYEGMFYMNNREGYGTLMYASGDIFQGLYKQDNRYGPGVLRYPNNNVDVGYWNGDKLARLIVPFGVEFTSSDGGIEEIDKSVELTSWFDREYLLHDTLNPQNLFLNRIFSNKANNFIKTDPHIDKVLQMKKSFNEEFIRAFERFAKLSSTTTPEDFNQLYKKARKITVENATPSLLDMFKHCHRYAVFKRNMQQILNLNLSAIESCNRALFSHSGLLETSSLEFMSACNERNLEKAKSLKSYVNVDVCDNKGYTSLILAVMKCDAKTINFLLDNGANVNHLLDNGLSALMICIIRYYTNDKFLPNSALKHQDLTVTRKINPDSMLHRTAKTSTPKQEQSEETASSSNIGSTKASEFDSDRSYFKFRISENEKLADQYVTLMSKLDSIEEGGEPESGRLFKKAAHLHYLNEVSSIIELLLRRGADPSLSCLPYSALCFAVAAGDVKIVRLLLEKGADSNKRMPAKYASLTPLCLACGVLDETGIELVKLLLDSLADPNASSDINKEYLSMNEEGWQNETVSDELADLVVGRTPLHIACARNDPYAPQVIALLLEHKANPNLICNGHSPLSLAIASGNKEAMDMLLKSESCDPNLPLTHGVGSALCAISSTLYEHRWTPHERIKLIDKLLIYGADILQPVAYGPRRYVGTVVDYAYYMFNSDMRIAHTPYHSLTHDERDTHNARKDLLSHLSIRFREKAVERQRLNESGHDYSNLKKKSWGPAIRRSRTDDTLSDSESIAKSTDSKRLPKWCYYCGRSVGVKLMLCSRCKKVNYCSNMCKNKAWNEFHRSECQLHDSHRRNRSAQRSRLTKESQKSKQSNDRLLQRDQYKKSMSLSINPLFNNLENYSYN